MACEEYTQRISARLDGELSPEESVRLDAHLAVCPQCRVLVRELEEMTAAFAQVEPVQAPRELSRGVMERIRNQRIARRRMVRRVSGLAAVLVLCAGLYPVLRAVAPAGKSGMAMEVADTHAPMEPARYAEQESAADGAMMDTADTAREMQTAGSAVKNGSVGGLSEDYKYKSALTQQRLRVSGMSVSPEPAAEVLDSVDTLNDFLARFTEADLTQATRKYDEEFFRTGRLLAVVVQEPSSSVTHEVMRLDEVQVHVNRVVPPAGDSDVACWLILVEGDENFGPARTLDVEWTEE